MTRGEVREVVTDLLDETPTVMSDGRMRNFRGPQWRPAGVHRRGETGGGADVRWYETVEEWFGRTA